MRSGNLGTAENVGVPTALKEIDNKSQIGRQQLQNQNSNMVQTTKINKSTKRAKKEVSIVSTILHITRLTIKRPKGAFKAIKVLVTKGPSGFVKYLFAKRFVVEKKQYKSPGILFQLTNLIRAGFRDPRRVYKALRVLIFRGPVDFYYLLMSKNRVVVRALSLNQQYKIWFSHNYPTVDELNQQYRDSRRFKYRPLISIITPTYNTPAETLKEMLESIIAQSYDNWELCLADDASKEPAVRKIIEKYSKKDKRIKYVFREQNGHICEASNSALSLAQGEFVGLVDHDDFLWPNALYEVVRTLNQYPQAGFLYSDEDKLTELGDEHIDPFFKPNWSPDYLRTVNYITHFAVIKKSIVDQIGGFRKGFEGAQDWDLFLRVSRELEGKEETFINQNEDKQAKIVHIPQVLYSWRKSPASTASGRSAVKNYAFQNQQKVLEDDLVSRGYRGEILETNYLGIWRVRYEIKDKPLVSIIIPTKDKFDYIKKCLDSLLEKTTYDNFEIVLIDSGSKDPRVWNLYEIVKKRFYRFKVIKWEKAFNFSSVCNLGAERATGEYLLFLNNDTEIITEGWIEAMLEHAQRPDVGAVGCKLLYPDNKIQHAGVILGIKGGVARRGVAGHAFKRFDDQDQGEHFQAIHSIKNYSAVTAACLLIAKGKYLAVGGQDEIFRIAFNDVDLCLKLLKKGWFNVYTPDAVLYHHESISVGTPESGGRNIKEFLGEMRLMNKRWSSLLDNDPFYNPNFTLDHEDFSLRI